VLGAAFQPPNHHRPKWMMAVEMLDELLRWGLTPPAMAADVGYGGNSDFRLG
jgi:hypothetical protein